MSRARKFLVPSVVACALLAALALATTASAEVRVGEATAPLNPSIAPEADVIAARAEYNLGTETITFKVTTAAAPSPGTEAEPSELQMGAGLTSPSTCSFAAIGSFAGFSAGAYPVFGFQYSYTQPNYATWVFFESPSSAPEFPLTAGVAVASISGTTTTLVATARIAANLPLSCAIVYVLDGHLTPQGEPLVFPIAVPPPPPPPVTTPPPTAAPPAPQPIPPAALAIAKPNPLTLAAGKWKTVRIKVANSGGAATAPGSLRLKAPRGVLVKPEKQKLPVLTPGGSWTISAKLQLTAKAKKKSTVSLTAAAPGVTAKGSLVLKRRG